VPTEPAKKNALIGQPTALVVEPPSVTLAGPRATQQLVVTGRYADGSIRDLTPVCDFTAEGAVVVLAKGGFVLPAKNGSGALVVKAGAQSVRVPVVVKDLEKPQPVSFRNDMIAALNVGGCNQGACHGTPSGKNGFKLSLRGFDPAADYVQLTRDVLGRRTDRLTPDASLILQKGLGRVPHEGGQRYVAHSVPAESVRLWLAEGLKDDPANLPALRGIQVLPGSRVQSDPARWQQLSVMAQFSDGSVRDVTRLTVFSSSDSVVADVSPTGLVEFRQAGEVAVLCRFLMELQTVRLTFLEPRPGFVWPNPPEVSYLDHHVFAKLRTLRMHPSPLCSDSVFLRRAYLDAAGILPTPDELQKFLADKAPDKRAKLIDALLERPEYVDYWTYKWSDLLLISSRHLPQPAVWSFHQFVRPALNGELRARGIDTTLLVPDVALEASHENRALLWQYALDLLAKIYPQYSDRGLTITLPWDRTFETKIDVRL